MTDREILAAFNAEFKLFIAADEDPQNFRGDARDAADTAWARMLYLSGEADKALSTGSGTKGEKL